MDTQSTSARDLATFVANAKEHHVADDAIVGMLRSTGWPEKRVFGALATHYANVLGAPIPTRGASGENARDAFYYLLNFLSLSGWTVALGSIFYVFVAHWFPDAATAPYERAFSRDEIAWQLATILVTFPLFAFVHAAIGRQLRKRPDLYESGVRRWLTYIALVVAAGIVVGDGVWFLYGLLRGHLTTVFMLDSLMLAAIAGGVFTYYLSTMDAPRGER